MKFSKLCHLPVSLQGFRLAATIAMLAAVGCKGDSPPAPAPAPAIDVSTPEPAPAPDVAAPAPADIAPPPVPANTEIARVAAALKVDFVTSTEGVLHVCGNTDDDTRACLVHVPERDVSDLKGKPLYTVTVLPLGDDDVDHVPEYPAGFDDGFRREEGRPITKLCVDPTKGCKDIFVGRVTAARINATRTRAILTTVNEDDTKTARVFAVESLQQQLEIPLPGSTFMDCSFGAFVGDNIVLGAGPCHTNDGATAWIASGETGEKIADLGGKPTFVLRNGHFAKVSDTHWAFRAADGTEVVIADVTTGETLATVATGVEVPRKTSEKAWVFDHGPNRVLLVEAGGESGVEIVMVDAVAKNVLARFKPGTSVE